MARANLNDSSEFPGALPNGQPCVLHDFICQFRIADDVVDHAKQRLFVGLTKLLKRVLITLRRLFNEMSCGTFGKSRPADIFPPMGNA